MRIGLPFSAAVHAGVVLLTVIALPPPEIDDPDPYIFIPVELVTLGAETNIRASSDDLSPLDPSQLDPSGTVELPGTETSPLQEETVERELLPEPEPELVPETAPETPDPKQTPDEPPAPVPDKRAKPVPQKPPATEKGLEDILGTMGPFINREREGRPPPRSNPGAIPGGGSGPPQAGTGAQSDMTVTVRDLIRARLEKCWSPPVDQPEPRRLKVQVSFELNRDGTLVPDSERILQPARLNPADRAMLIATERALNAVRACSPFAELVSLPYDGWRTVTFPFDPSAMVQ